MIIDELQVETKTERPGKAIKLEKYSYLNKNVSGRVGTLDDKKSPQTVYLFISFWVDIKEREDCDNFDDKISKKFEKELKKIYKENLFKILKNNKYFPFFNENIYIYDFPVNLNYNNKKSFVSIELNLHTINCVSKNDKKYSLKNKKENELFSELIKMYEIICNSDLLLNKTEFSISKTKK